MNDWVLEIRKLSKIKKLFLILILVILLASCFWIYITKSVWKYYDFNMRTVDAFLTYMSEEQYELAYGKFADKYKKEEDIEKFKKESTELKDVYLNYEPSSFRITGTTRFVWPIVPAILEYKGEIGYKDGRKRDITVQFISESDDWRLYLVEFKE